MRATQPTRAGPRARPTAPAWWGTHGHARDVYRQIVGDEEPEPLISHFLELVRTLWQRPCCYATCLSPPTPRRDAFETRCRVCSTWRQPSKLRAQPLDIAGRPQKSTVSRPETRGRYQFIRSRHLEARKRRLSRSASSTIEDHTMLDLTSTSIDAADIGTMRSGATAPTAVDTMIATKTGWL